LPKGNKDDILRNIHNKLLTIDAYLNERGNKFDGIIYQNLGKINLLQATTSLDILIFGGSRSGKSTFINKLSNLLLVREQKFAETFPNK
jgi:ribosome biogenesis GTPase A